MITVDALTARVIHIDSRLRKGGRAGDFTVELNDCCTAEKGIDFVVTDLEIFLMPF